MTILLYILIYACVEIKLDCREMGRRDEQVCVWRMKKERNVLSIILKSFLNRASEAEGEDGASTEE
jgi:hypothetical protein